MKLEYVTEQVSLGEPDGELAPLLRCVCGKEFEPWSRVISIYDDASARPMECCGRRLIFRQSIAVYTVTGDDA